ncbi:MAG: PAS domain-containing protein [Salinivirgaceae bacterium]|nr:PAS domain-containing protein [Salinivirgaceae bacterium]
MMKGDLHIEYQKLKKEKDFLQNLFDALPASVQVVQIDEEGNPTPIWVNKSYENIYGYTLEDRQNLSVAEFYHPDDIEQVRKAVRHSFKDETFRDSVVCRIKTSQGEWKWVYIYGCRFKFGSEGKYMLTTSMEITDSFAFNHSRVQEYMKEITRLENKLSLSKLTAIELEIVCLLANGKSVKEIAELRNRSYETINNHKRNVFKKLGFTKLTELVCFCAENGLI